MGSEKVCIDNGPSHRQVLLAILMQISDDRGPHINIKQWHITMNSGCILGYEYLNLLLKTTIAPVPESYMKSRYSNDACHMGVLCTT